MLKSLRISEILKENKEAKSSEEIEEGGGGGEGLGGRRR